MSFCQCPLFFWFPLTPLPPCHPSLPPLCLPFALSFPWCQLSEPRKYICRSTDRPEVVGWSWSWNWSLGLWFHSLEPCSAWSLSLVSVPFCSYIPHPSSLSPLPASPPRPPLPGRLQTLNQQPAPRSADRGLSVSEGSWVGSGSLRAWDWGWEEGRAGRRTGG